MNSFYENSINVFAPPEKSQLNYSVVSMAGGVLLLSDPICLLLAAFLSTLLYAYWLSPLVPVPGFGSGFGTTAVFVAVLAPFILYDKRFGSIAARGHIRALVRSHVARFAIFSCAVLALGGISHALDDFPHRWLLIWFFTSLALTSLTRALVTRYLRSLQRQGILAEVIAVVGAGPVADRLVNALRQTRPDTVEVLGIFDDKIIGATRSDIKPVGTLVQLIELGKTRKIDWILLTLPPTAEQRVLTVVQRLKALSVPIGLCPQHVGLTVPYRTINYVADSVPVSLLADRPIKRWDAVIKRGEDCLPRWVVTLILLPMIGIESIAGRVSRLVRVFPKIRQQHAANPVFQFDNYDLQKFVEVAAHFGMNHYGYAVTPNTDHVIRLHDNSSFRALYSSADYILLDSRFLSNVLRITRGINLPVCAGSDLTKKLFSDVILPDDPVVLIGGNDEQARLLANRYGLRRLAHFNPPMGFIRNPEEVEACLRFIESHSPFRFCLLAVGAPQQEDVAKKLKDRGIARGLALCIGASINFLTGDERRAPLWMRRSGIEWLFRLMQSPRRMARRYLVRGPRVFGFLHNSGFVLRNRPTHLLRSVEGSNHPVMLTANYSGPARLAHAHRENRVVNATN